MTLDRLQMREKRDEIKGLIAQRVTIDWRVCPFCGSEVINLVYGGSFKSSCFHVQCASCGSTGPDGKGTTKNAAVKAWNGQKEWIDF